MNLRRHDQLPDELRQIDAHLRSEMRQEEDALKLDELKRRALTRAARAGTRQRAGGRSRLATLLLVFGLTLGSGGAAVLAAKTSSGGGTSAASSEYKCNSGIGNSYEDPATAPSPDCDPGNSPGNNATNECEGPVNTRPPSCKPAPQPKPR